MSAASDATYPPTGPPTTQVLGTTITQVPQAPSATQLPFTGAPIADYTTLGVALVLLGALLSAVRRRRRDVRSATG